MVSVPLSEDSIRTWGFGFLVNNALSMGGCIYFDVVWHSRHEFSSDFWRFWGIILRDEMAVGRGVHRFWGSPIQKSRSLFGPFSHFSRNFGNFGVGVIY